MHRNIIVAPILQAKRFGIKGFQTGVTFLAKKLLSKIVGENRDVSTNIPAIISSKAKNSTQQFKLLTVFLQKMLADVDTKKQTNAAAAIHQVADAIHKRSLVIIFSDMFDDVSKQDELFSALQHLKYSKHEVILFHVVNKDKEIDFEYENRPYEFEDMETGERIKLQPNQIKEHYTQQVKAYTENLKMKCLQYKIDFVEADINKGFKEILQSYLIKRKKMGA